MAWSGQTLAGSRVLVMGLGRSGRGAAQLALALGADVHGVDLREDAAPVPGATHRLGPHEATDFERADLVVVSPGIPARAPWLARARASGAETIGELGFAARFVQSAGVPMLAVTGTNGKSSTVSFAAQLAEDAGRRVFAGGNLGRPLSELALSLLQGKAAPDLAIVEVSSYQMELPGDFRPATAAVLNLTPDHLARHGTMAEYGAAKLRVFARMTTGSLAWMPAGVTALPHAAVQRTDGPTIRVLDGTPGVRVMDGVAHLTGTPDDGPLPLGSFSLPGAHNAANLGAAIALLVSAGVPRAALDPGCVRALPHRLEPVHEHDGVTWINDSKATNVEAAQTGITALTGPALVLLGGAGKDGADYASLLPALRTHARRVICFGASGRDIAAALPLPGTQLLEGGLEAAVHDARTHARPGDTILLSPACASFDEFRNFEHRGEVFADLARRGQP